VLSGNANAGPNTLRFPGPKLVHVAKNNSALRLVKPIFRIAMLMVPQLVIHNCVDSYRIRYP
jgi:hypothetical protein